MIVFCIHNVTVVVFSMGMVPQCGHFLCVPYKENEFVFPFVWVRVGGRHEAISGVGEGSVRAHVCSRSQERRFVSRGLSNPAPNH